LPREFNQFIVWRDQILEQPFVGIADHRDQHAVLDFNRKADVNGRRMNNFVSDQAAGRGTGTR